MWKTSKSPIISTVIFSVWIVFSAQTYGEELKILEMNLSTASQQSHSFLIDLTNTFTLQQAIEFAITHNPDLQIARHRISQAEVQLAEALASFYPQITARYSYQYTENPAMAFTHTINQRRLDFNSDFNHPGGVQNFRPEIVANYSLFRGGQDYQRSQAAKLGIEAATLEQSAIRNKLTQAVISNYYGYLAALEVHKVTLDSIKAVTSELNHSRTRYRAGSLLKSDVLSLEVQLAEAEDAKIKSKNSIELAKTALKTLLGIPMNQPFEIAKNSDWQLPQKKPDFDSILELAIKQRPEIKVANKQIEIQQRLVDAAEGAHLPRANAYVSYGQDSRDGSFSSNRDYLTAGVNVEMDIFSGFATTERIRKAQRKLAELQELQRRIHLSIENEVKTAYLRLQEALTRIDITIAAIASANEANRMVKEQRQAGTASITRYIESEVAKNKAHSRAIAAQFDALRAEAELNKALGLWR